MSDRQEPAALSAFRVRARAWLEAHRPPEIAAEADPIAREAADVAASRAWQRSLYEGGWAGRSWPVELGGAGLGPAEEMVFATEAARVAIRFAPLDVGIGMVAPTLIAHGSRKLQRLHLPALLRGETIWCQLFSEPGAGSDLAGLTTGAVPTASGWIVNGHKVWTSHARHADYGILLARTDAATRRHQGISVLVVDMRAPGITVRPLRQMTGEAHFNEVLFDDVAVGAESVIGPVGDGWRVARTTLASERGLVGPVAGGFAALRQLVLSVNRHHDPVVRQRAATAYTDESLLRWLGARAQARVERGLEPGPESSVMKLLLARHTKRTTEFALSLTGAEGMLAAADATDGGFWLQAFLSHPAIRIAGGSDEIQRSLIGERGLGLPREPQAGR
ncbi:MAG: acyl-CoA dehydrogenase [Actinomycetia bacterium]|nr:acyl-CoA dehydrogenase [Actinomycetes bacterium]